MIATTLTKNATETTMPSTVKNERRAFALISWIAVITTSVKTILWQFLVEAATLTCIGAGIGLIAGSAVAFLVNKLTPVPASTPPLAIAAALGVSAVTGIVFGLLPAARASRLDPVEALRYE